MIAHALKRLDDHRGICLARSEYFMLAIRIRAGEFPVERHDHNGQPVYRVRIRSTTVWAVWCPQQDCVRTFLPSLDRLVMSIDAVHPSVFAPGSVPASPGLA